MTRILIPIDGSVPSVHALDYVLARKKSGERIEAILINVQPDIRPGRMVSRQDIADWQAQESAKALGKADVKSRAKKLKADVITDVGDAAEAIIGAAKQHRCQGIVMGTRGLNRLKGFFMGSVATKVVQLSPIPVTLVK